tara:strand:- start:1646 stop:1861 length:216 start_codon:yes stop_codon:yes gene_type:complete
MSETMDFIANKVFFISLGQIGFMFLTCFLCLLYGKYKTGLLISYFFIFLLGALFPTVFTGWKCLVIREWGS